VTNFQYSGLTQSSVNLKWDAHPFALSYRIDYSYDGGATFNRFDFSASTTQYNNWMGFPCGSTVVLRLTAQTSAGDTPYAQVDFVPPC
jgi:hypothetical protein